MSLSFFSYNREHIFCFEFDTGQAQPWFGFGTPARIDPGRLALHMNTATPFLKHVSRGPATTTASVSGELAFSKEAGLHTVRPGFSSPNLQLSFSDRLVARSSLRDEAELNSDSHLLGTAPHARRKRPHVSPHHVPVLLEEVLEYLDLANGQVVVDGTVGAGGHSQEIVSRIGSEGTLIGLDRDPMMLDIARQQLKQPNCHLYHARYADLADVLERHRERTGQEIQNVDRVLLDLGLSSDQLADEARGFSFSSLGELDLRFDVTSGEPAWRILERASEREIGRILMEYGEERFSRRIARELVSRRRSKPVRTASDLVDAVSQAVPKRFQRQARRQPATRVFQAFRIAANDELQSLEHAFQSDLYACLATGGRIVAISFHSLEDRIVKEALRDKTRWSRLTKKPIQAGPAEKRLNPRCRSAKLRAAVKI